MKYYILANGEGTRWGNYKGVPKQLIEIDGETILHRMVRLLRDEGVSKEDICICGKFEDDDAVSVVTESKTKREVFEEIANIAKGPFAILYGDCYYTQAIVHEIVNRPINKFDEFFCAGPNPHTGCPWPEGYAHRCVDWEWWRDAMHEINTSPELIKTCKDWFIHWWLLGVRDERINEPPIKCYDREHDIAWLDETDDFDYPIDLERFLRQTGHECTNKWRDNKLSIIIPFYDPEGKMKDCLVRLLDRLKPQIDDYPETEVIVVADGTDSGWLKGKYPIRLVQLKKNQGVSHARNVGLDQSSGQYISFIDADDEVEPNYVHTLYSYMRDEYADLDYVLFPFFVEGGVGSVRNELIGNDAVWAWCFNYRIICDKRFNEKLNVGEDREWLESVIRDHHRREVAAHPIYRYNWGANPDSLCQRYNRGELSKERE